MGEFLAEWGPSLIAIVGIIVMYRIYHAGKTKEKKKEEENIKEKLVGVEKVVDKLFIIYPQLKSLDKLDNPNLTEEDVKRISSELLEATKIPDMIDTRIEKGIKKELSAVDKMVTTLVAQKLEEADKQSGKLIGDPSDYVKLGEASFMEGNNEKAIEHYKKAIELNQNYADAWFYKGVALYSLGRNEEALKVVEKAIELEQEDDVNAVAWGFKGAVLRELGRDEEADKADKKANELRKQKKE